MNVLLDAHILGQRETGNETYIRELVRQTTALEAAGVILTAAVTPGQEVGLPRVIVDGRLNQDWYRLTRLLPRLAANAAADLVHVTYHGPLSMRAPMVVTIHDVSYRVRARYHSARNVLLQNALGWWTARRSRLIITVSEFCRSEIERIYPFAGKRIAVTYETSAPAEHAPQAMDRLRTLGVGASRFVFSLGRFQPRKNMARLARAFVSAFGDAPDVKLVLAGDNATPTGAKLRAEFGPWIGRGQIVLPGYLSAEDTSLLYSSCAAFAFPSLYEGFGLPVLEAMRLGAPVITSSTTALPEIAGDAALLVDPEDETAIADALKRVLSDTGVATGLADRGRARAAFFTGQRFAAATAAAYARALDAPRHDA